MKKKKIIITVIISLVLFPLAAYGIYYAYHYSHRWWGVANQGKVYEENFKMMSLYKKMPYALGEPLHEIDVNRYYNTFHIADSLEVNNQKIKNEIVLPCDVEYYTTKEEKEPALVLKKGTTVFYRLEDGLRSTFGYGARCWPDYEKGWRYGYPFLTDEEEQPESLQEDLDMYYVKDSQLREVAIAYYEANDSVKRDFAQISKYLTKKDYAQYETTVVDQIMVSQGAYLSEYMKDWK